MQTGLDALENARCDLGLMPLGRAVNNPNVVTRSPEIIAHLFEARARYETRQRI